MKVLLNEQGYVVSYAFEGDLLDAVEAAEPADLSHFEECFTAYRVQDGVLVFDDAQAVFFGEGMDLVQRRRKPHTASGGRRSAFPSSTGGGCGMTPSPRSSSRS